MTVGDKIKYYRTHLGITQSQLAQAAGIHLVSIKKYETNKMQPQSPQIERIATALNVSYNALMGLETAGLRLNTVGDLMGILIILCNSQIIFINGKRGKDYLLEPESLSIQINPLLNDFFKICVSDGKDLLSLTEASFYLTCPLVLPAFLKWEKINYLYKKAMAEHGENANEQIMATIAHMEATKEQIELELQRSTVMLDMSDDIKMQVPPNYDYS